MARKSPEPRQLNFQQRKRVNQCGPGFHGNEHLALRSSYKKWPWKGMWVTTAAASIIFISASSPSHITQLEGGKFYLSIALLSLGVFFIIPVSLFLVFYLWFLIWTQNGLEIPRCCWCCSKIIQHEYKHKKKLNFHNEQEKYKGPTVWCIEEQIKKLPDHGNTLEYETCERRSVSVISEDDEFTSSASRNGEISFISERNITAEHNKNITDTTTAKVESLEPKIGRINQFSAKNIQKQPILNPIYEKSVSNDEDKKENQKESEDRANRKLHDEMFDKKGTWDVGYKNEICSNLGSGDNTVISQENAKDPDEIILPRYLLHSWTKLEAVHIKEANAKVMYNYWNTLLKRDLKSEWLDKLKLNPVQKRQIRQQLEQLDIQNRQEILCSYIHGTELKIVRLEQQRKTILKEMEIIILEYISTNPGINHDQHHMTIKSSLTGGAKRILENDHLEIPDHIVTIWNDIETHQVEEYNTRLQYHYFNILLKYTLGASNFDSNPKENKYCNRILQLNILIENKLQDLEKQRKDKLKWMDNMLLSRRACSGLTMEDEL